jgi:hypothetical protein
MTADPPDVAATQIPPWGEENEPDQKRPSFQLKPLEIVVGAAAATVTAFASSALGVAGTLGGAGVASVVTTVSSTVLRHSAERTNETLRRTTRRRQRVPAAYGNGDAAPTRSATEQPANQAGPWRRWAMLAGAAVTVFALAMGGITGLESIIGRPLSALFGHGPAGGSSVGQVFGNHPQPTRTVPAPTTRPSGSTAGQQPSPTAPPSTAVPTAPPASPSASAPAAGQNATPTS